MVAVYVGTSGWHYDHWTGVLYPEGTPPRARLDFYTARFGTAELNASYYRWPSDASFAYWRRRLPSGFVLSVKAPAALSHVKRLFAPERWIARIDRGLAHLGIYRGVLLVQLSPRTGPDEARLRYFLSVVPRTCRIAIEFRHPDWHHDRTFRILEEYGAAYCVMSGARLPCSLTATAPFVYLRLHGPDHDHLYGGSYSDDDLRWWADRVREWEQQGREVFVYFNNDGFGHAVNNALTLRRLLGR